MPNGSISKPDEVLNCGLLIAGSGLAGIRAAYDAAMRGIGVLWLTDGELCSGSSFYPLTGGLGSQAADSPGDEEVFLEEVLETGRTVADPGLSKLLIGSIGEEMKRLPEIGIHAVVQKCDRPACFAKRERLIYDWSGWDETRSRVREIFGKLPNVVVREHCQMARLVKKNGRISGALFVNEKDRLCYVRCGAVLLATGGFCGLYRHSLNTMETMGAGHSLAMDAGAELVNMEFIQFIPGFTKPVYKLLFSETTLRRAVSVRDEEGRDALREYLAEVPEAEGVSFRDCLDDRAMHGPFTTEDRSAFFELAMMKDASANHRECGFEITFDPGITEDLNGFIRMAVEMYSKYGIDLSKDRIRLAPFAHCANGGIRIGQNGETGVLGLFAAGETAGGIHGADRHGGMATAAALVFGHRAAEGAADYLKGFSSDSGGFTEDIGREAAEAVSEFFGWTGKAGGGKNASEILLELAEDLWYYANCLRNGRELEELLGKIREERKRFSLTEASASEGWKAALKAFHGLRTAEALILAMLERRESRGPHCRSDFPAKDRKMDGIRILVLEENGTFAAKGEKL